MGVLRFAGFTLDVGGGALTQAGKRVALRRQPFKVLAYLAEHPGRLVSNKELIDKCWDNPRHTSVNSLAQCIKAIRESLGETEPEIIRTVHGQGYVFAPPVLTMPPEQRADAAAPQAAHQTPPHAQSGQPPSGAGADIPPAAQAHGPLREALHVLREVAHRVLRRKRHALAAGIILAAVLLVGSWAVWTWATHPVQLAMSALPSIAVLPIKFVGAEPDKSDLAGALTGEIETELSRIPRGFDIRVRLAPGYKGPIDPPRAAGRNLGVRYLALGSIRRDGDGRHINVQLVEAESGRAIWAEPFLYDPGEPHAQSRVATWIARMLQSQILRAESRRPLPARPEAGHYVILGRAHMTGEHGVGSNQAAMDYFDKARALDPRSVPALQGGARVRVNKVLNRWVPKESWGALLDEAEDAIKRAMSLEAGDAGLHVLRGAYLRARSKDAEAIKAFERALELHPNYPLALAELGRAKIEVGLAHETVGHIKEAISLSPKEPYGAAWYYWAGMAEAHLGHYAEARAWLLQARNANRAYPNVVPWLAVAHAGLDEWTEARTYMEEHRKTFPRFSMVSWRLAMPQRNQAVIPQRQRIEALLRRLGAPERPPPDDKVQTGLVGGAPGQRAPGQ
jgi:DNA-binding winged helix-turn-helix (wHTH) protein/TolB-like protein/Flp pilus assembly protein TadD